MQGKILRRILANFLQEIWVVAQTFGDAKLFEEFSQIPLKKFGGGRCHGLKRTSSTTLGQ